MSRSKPLGPVVLAGLALVLTSSVSAQPVDVRAHDPVMIEQGGTYYVFATGPGVRVWRSEDRRQWEPLGSAFDAAPDWASDVVSDFRGDLWAPDVVERDGTYYLYYSVSSLGRNTSAIGVATSPTLDPEAPGYGWTDRGVVVESVPGRDLWNAIDPAVTFDADGTPWLAFGSFWGGLKLVQLDETLTRPAEPQRWRTIAARPRYWKLNDRDAGDEMNGAVEAPFIFEKDGWYYLFASWDQCCRGAESTYKVVVGRSRNVTGPYLDKTGVDMTAGGGTYVVSGNEEWPGVGHNAAYTFDGTDYLVFHAYNAAERGRPQLWITPIEWDEQGWPTVSLD